MKQALAAAPVVVRDAQDTDMSAVQAIYAHHVLTGLASFEEVPPTVEEMRKRRSEIVAHDLPYLVAEIDGKVIGFAYVGRFRPRSAYRFSVEDSIYMAPEAARRGVGRRLLDTLIDRCTRLGYRQMVAVIGDSGNDGSIGLHAAAGFSRVALLPSIGFKSGRWVDSVLMQRALGDGDTTLPAAGR
jgi:L-amino acid N-acyltransferase YncA